MASGATSHGKHLTLNSSSSISKKEAYIATFKFFKMLYKLKLARGKRMPREQWIKVKNFLEREFNARDP